MQQVERKPRLYLSPTGGLANRLMGLLSCHRLTKMFGWDMRVSWPATYVMRCTPADLFANPPVEWADDEDISHIPDDHRIYLDAGVVAEGTPPILDLERMKTDTTIATNCYLGHPNEGRGKTFHNYTSSVLSVATSLADLGLSSEVSDTLDRFIDIHGDLKDAVGIHIRRGPYDVVEKSYFSLVTDDDYSRLADLLTQGGRIVLATDSTAVREDFQKKFGDRLVTYTPRSLERADDYRAIQDAFVEMLLLSKCRAVAGIAWSTFAYFATQIRCIPYLEIIPPGGGGPENTIYYHEHRYLDSFGNYDYRKSTFCIPRV